MILLEKGILKTVKHFWIESKIINRLKIMKKFFSRKKIICIIFLLLIINIIGLLYLIEYRCFFKFNNMDFTVWNTINELYIIPGKYCKFKIPEKDFIRIQSSVELIIYVDDNGVYQIFTDLLFSSCSEPYTPEVTLQNIEYQVHTYFNYAENNKNMEEFENNKVLSKFDYNALDNFGQTRYIVDNNIEELKFNLTWISQRFFLGMLRKI